MSLLESWKHLEPLETNRTNNSGRLCTGVLFLVGHVDDPLVLHPFDLSSALDLDLYMINPQNLILSKDSRLTIGPMSFPIYQYKS